MGFAEARRLDRSQVSGGGGRCHRRGWIQGQGSLGRVSGRGAFSDGYSSSIGKYLLRLVSKPSCNGVPLGLGCGGGRIWWGSLKLPVDNGSKDLFAIFIFLEALCAKRMG
ncbi:hypothetical protein PAHAL_4G037000 [Panicum hallii]|jgi:hypothetical protein|uniref:Uncharacterized protein n=1 Tax=Panicum hallii TaxID=206008 RepID=A0A2S3HGY5_9POAL|nr:hypothetical protein PAHAL_4G037000 [Panicum hallii]